MSLILLLLLMVDSDDLNEVTLLFQSTCIQSYSIANTIRAYSGIKAPPDVALFLTKRVIHGVWRCVVLTGSENPGCSCSWSPRGSTSLALFPPMSECSSCSSLVESSQLESRDLLRPSSEALLVLPPDVTLFLTTSNVNKIGRGIVSSGSSEDPSCFCSFLTREGTSPALIPPTPVDLGTGSRRLRVSDTNRSKS